MAPATFGFKSCGMARLKAEKLGDSCRAELKGDDRNIMRMSTHVIIYIDRYNVYIYMYMYTHMVVENDW